MKTIAGNKDNESSDYNGNKNSENEEELFTSFVKEQKKYSNFPTKPSDTRR